jgi:hypothetical protein
MDLDDGQFEGSEGDRSFSSTVDLTGTGLYSLTDAGTLVLASGATISGGQSTMLSSATPPVPEPSTWAMMALGFAGLGFAATGGPPAFGFHPIRSRNQRREGRPKGGVPSFAKAMAPSSRQSMFRRADSSRGEA